MFRNKKGGSLVMVLMTTLVVGIIIAGLMSLSWAYYRASYRDNDRRQAYLYAKSTCQAISKRIIANDNAFVNFSGSKNITNITLDADKKYKATGQLSKMNEDGRAIILIKVKAIYQNQSSTVTLRMISNGTGYDTGVYNGGD